MKELPSDLALLQTFHEVALTGSVTQAARHLGRSQPAVSHRLRALERDLGVPLFEKVGRRLRLTEHGRKLQAECADLMARCHAVFDRVAGASGTLEGRVAIGTLPSVASHLLVPALHELMDRHPGLALSFQFGFAADLTERLRTGELDVLVVVGEEEQHGLVLTKTCRVSLAAVMAPELAPEGDVVRVGELKRRRYLSYGSLGDPTFDRVDRYAARHGLVEPSTPHVPHIETLRALACAGAGYAILPTYTTLPELRAGRLVACRPAGLEVGLDVSIVVRRGQVVTPALDAVRTALANLPPELVI